MITQNKGEWSEMYVFLKLLGDGVLYAGDGELNKIPELYYPLIKILRKEKDDIKYYVKEHSRIKILSENGQCLLKFPCEEFMHKAEVLLKAIKEGHNTFSVPVIEDFMQLILCSKVKADSYDKSDITVVLHDRKICSNETFGFSIKSRLGNPSTLLNAAKATNFIFEIRGNLTQEQIEEINNTETTTKFRDRLAKLKGLGCELSYYETQNETFTANMQMTDTQLPLIIAEYLKQYYSGLGTTVKELSSIVKKLNPCGLNTTLPHNYYAHKIKTFLTDVALGMTPARPWSGDFQATGGYIVVREDGEILCYHIYNHNEFKEYLFNNTRLETPSASRHDFGYVFTENEKNFIKLNLQIRFI